MLWHALLSCLKTLRPFSTRIVSAASVRMKLQSAIAVVGVLSSGAA